ncbi:hypothetical protein BDK51DRAFT_30644, partial [Blyttiomyces helicus]
NAFVRFDSGAKPPHSQSTVEWHGQMVPKVGGILELTVEPVTLKGNVMDAAIDMLTTQLASNTKYDVPVLLGYGHEMDSMGNNFWEYSQSCSRSFWPMIPPRGLSMITGKGFGTKASNAAWTASQASATAIQSLVAALRKTFSIEESAPGGCRVFFLQRTRLLFLIGGLLLQSAREVPLPPCFVSSPKHLDAATHRTSQNTSRTANLSPVARIEGAFVHMNNEIQPGFIYFNKNGISLSAAASMENLVDPESAGEGVPRHYVVAMRKINAFGTTACLDTEDILLCMERLLSRHFANGPDLVLPLGLLVSSFLKRMIGDISSPPPSRTRIWNRRVHTVFQQTSAVSKTFFERASGGHSRAGNRGSQVSADHSQISPDPSGGSSGAGDHASYWYIEGDDDVDFDDDLDISASLFDDSRTTRQSTASSLDIIDRSREMMQRRKSALWPKEAGVVPGMESACRREWLGGGGGEK